MSRDELVNSAIAEITPAISAVAATGTEANTVLLRDTFSHDVAPGKVIGSRSSDGKTIRHGVDVENLLGIDHGALRIQPLLRPGWGRAGLAYGPFPRTDGLAFAAFLVNGHNTSQTGAIEQLVRRIWRWVRASETESRLRRLLRWLKAGRKGATARLLLRWILSAPRIHSYVQPYEINENLALGWFPSPVPADPLAEGHSFAMHATGAENGELWIGIRRRMLPVIRGVQNVPFYFIVVLRAQGAAYYLASLPNARGAAAYPAMRPIAVDPVGDDSQVYAGLYQSVLGQIGFRVDTRVYGTCVARLAELSSWYGTAHAADRLAGQGDLAGSAAEIGGNWQVWHGRFERNSAGTYSPESDSLAILRPAEPSGLIHVLVGATAGAVVEMIWRILDQRNYWYLRADDQQCLLAIVEQGNEQIIATGADWRLLPGRNTSLQVLDDGIRMRLSLNGQLVFAREFNDSRLAAARGLGFRLVGQQNTATVSRFEAHPRQLAVPAALELGAPWSASGTQVVAADDFRGNPAELAGRATPVGARVWRRELGTGTVHLTGNQGARVQASTAQPNPGRTLYTLPWDNPQFADLQLSITPPGSARGRGDCGRGGLVFWQDPQNYIIVNNWLDDCYEGASVSSFFYLNGVEELYDAVWTNVGERIQWGSPHRLRVVFDGMHYLVYVDDEPVLYRALSDVYPEAKYLTITRVGLAVNWEWGNDTGSLFQQFVARS